MRHSPNSIHLLLAACMVLPLALIASCAADDQAAIDPPEPTFTASAPEWTGKNRPVVQMLSSPQGGENPNSELVSQRRLVAETVPDGAAPELYGQMPGELTRVKYTARAAKADEVIRAIVGDFLDRDYVIDPKVTGNVTIDIDQDMTHQDIMDLLGGLAMLHGWSISDHAGVLHIRTATDIARSADVPILKARTALDTDEPAIRVRTMRYLGAGEVTQLLTDLMSSGATAAAVGQTIIMVDTVRQLNKVSRVLSALDVPEFGDVNIWTYRLATRKPDQAAELLRTITSHSGLDSGSDPLAAFVPVPGTDRLMVISKDPSVQTLIRSLIEDVDSTADAAKRTRYLYHIQHYEPAQLQAILELTFSERIEKDQDDPADTGIRLVLDADNHFLIIHAVPSDYAELMDTIAAIDRAPMQVRVQSIILEVELNDALQYGVEYFLNALDEEGVGVLDLTGAVGAVADPTASAFFVGGDGLAVVTALQNESKVEILSRPELFILNNSSGEFKDGGEVPYVSADVDTNVQTEGNTGIRREIEYRDTGVKLTITPRINESGQIRLEIDEEITAVGGETELGPAFTTRTIHTEAVVPHGHTLMIGGIIRTDSRQFVDKIPILGDLPLIGAAFRSANDRDVRNELLLAITPTIIEHPAFVGQGLSDFMQRARSVRDALAFIAEDEGVGPIIHAAPFMPEQHAPPSLVPESAPIDLVVPISQSEPQTRTAGTHPPLPPIIQAILGGELRKNKAAQPKESPGAQQD
jgi:general secretion pathway protein D